MANKPPEMDLSEAFTTFAKNAESMQQAMKLIASPMREISEMMKAINQNSKDASDNAKKQREDEEKKTKEKRIQIDAENEMLKVVTELSLKKGELTAEGEKLRQQTLDLIKDQMAIKEIIADNSRHYAEQTRETRAHQEALEAQIPIWDRIGRAANKAYEEAARNHKALATASGSVNELMFGRGTSSADKVVAKIGSQISSLIPTAGGIGGIMGLIMFGMQRDAEFAAIGEASRQVFDKVGGASKKFASEIESTSRDLSIKGIIDKTELANVAEGFANLGYKVSDINKPIEGFNYRVNNLITATLSMDKALELPAGTMSKMAGTMSQMFNTSLEKSVESLWKVGVAAEKSGANMATFMQQALEAASALRMLNANGEAVGSMQYSLMKRYKDGGYLDPVALSRAAAGTASAMQAVAGLDVGMSAVIGDRLGKGSGLDAWYAMKGGDARSGGSSLKVEDIVAEMAKIATETTGSRSEQVYMLMQLTGASKEGAEAILDANDEIAETGKMSADAIKKMNEGFMTEGDKTSAIVRSLKQIEEGFANFGSGILVVIVGTLKAIYHGIQQLIGVSMSINPFATDNEKFYGTMMRFKHGNEATKSWETVFGSSGWGRASKGLEGVLGGSGNLVGMTGLDKGWSINPYDKSGLTEEQQAELGPLMRNIGDRGNRKSDARRMVEVQSGNFGRGMDAAFTGGLGSVIYNLKDAISGIISYMSSGPNKRYGE